MELDKRIKNRGYILDCFNAHIAEQYVGEECYMTSFLEKFSDLSSVNKFRLDSVKNSYFYNEEVDRTFDFCLPVSLVSELKEKTYRPYTLEEFINEGFEILVLLNKESGSEYHVRYNGFIKKVNGNCLIILGNVVYTLEELFECFTYLDSDGIFKPFGVEE